MNVITKLKNSVENATGLPFYYDTPQTLNVRLERAKFPCAMLNILQTGAVVSDNGIIRERLQIEMLFVTNSDLDFDGETVERDELDEMKLYAFTWLLSLMRGGDFKLAEINGTSRYYATGDAIYSAYGVNVTIEEAEGVSSCTEITDFDI